MFAEACRSAFITLVHRYQFSEPEVEPIGRECFVRFHKGPKTVSVAWEPGLAPIVELFYPAGPDEKVTPWAARNSVPYARRIPRIAPRVRYDAEDADSMAAYLRESMQQLTEVERDFLEG
jgi:hypothetical protein